MDLDEAIGLSLKLLKDGKLAKYGYDFYPPAAAEYEIYTRQQIRGSEGQAMVVDLSVLFLDAAWIICQRGFVRPGTRHMQGQPVDAGGYSLTQQGRKLLDQLDDAALVIMQPGALAKALSDYEAKFGSGFVQRSQEAIRCRDASAWLGCCSMVGAAAESVLLAVAIAKVGNETAVLNEYQSSSGRRKVLNMIVGQKPQHIRDQLVLFTNIISMWRDEASHGKSTPIDTANADEALRQLLHMCQWVDREWTTLTS